MVQSRPHPAGTKLAEAVYGLPEFCRSAIPGARLISNPGCYPTAANLAIRPLVAAGVVDRAAGIICDGKSGTSGAGRKASLKTSFCEVTENLSAYSVLNHRHIPEVLRISGLEEREFSFTAQLLPIDRGILETVYFRSSVLKSVDELVAIYDRQYDAEPFVRLYEIRDLFPDLRGVARTNFCDIGVAFDAATGRGVVVSAIDNLVKGVAGQAVQEYELRPRLPLRRTGCFRNAHSQCTIGGTLLDSPETRQALAGQIALAKSSGYECVVVHGGGKQMTRFLEDRGVPSRFVNGLRVTTPETIDAVLKVLAGSVNQELVSALIRAQVAAVGLTGLDGNLVEAVQMDPELGAVGRVTKSNGALLELLALHQWISTGCGVPRRRISAGNFYNVNGDQMAVAVRSRLPRGEVDFLDGCARRAGRGGKTPASTGAAGYRATDRNRCGKGWHAGKAQRGDIRGCARNRIGLDCSWRGRLGADKGPGGGRSRDKGRRSGKSISGLTAEDVA